MGAFAHWQTSFGLRKMHQGDGKGVKSGASYRGSTQGWGSCSLSSILSAPKSAKTKTGLIPCFCFCVI